MQNSDRDPRDLLDHKRNVFSQNGEDGIIEELFRRIGVEARTCCEFGAWDGVHLSNCRRLILAGWRALMIEGDSDKAKVLAGNYAAHPTVTCVNRFADDRANSLSSILKATAFPPVLDFLSIDIDGFDYEIFQNLDIRPRVICIEVNAAFRPDSDEVLPRAVAGTSVGQPMSVYMRIAREKGYALVGYSGNAFFVREDIVQQCRVEVITPVDAYLSYLHHLEPEAKEWMWLVNCGLIPPHRRYHNPRLTRSALGIGWRRLGPVLWIAARQFLVRVGGYLRARWFGR